MIWVCAGPQHTHAYTRRVRVPSDRNFDRILHAGSSRRTYTQCKRLFYLLRGSLLFTHTQIIGIPMRFSLPRSSIASMSCRARASACGRNARPLRTASTPLVHVRILDGGLSTQLENHHGVRTDARTGNLTSSPPSARGLPSHVPSSSFFGRWIWRGTPRCGQRACSAMQMGARSWARLMLHSSKLGHP